MTEGQNKEDGKLSEGETPKPNKMKENMHMETTYCILMIHLNKSGKTGSKMHFAPSLNYSEGK